MQDEDWRALVKQIRRGKCLPLLSDGTIASYLFKDRNVVEEWARQIGYPLRDGYNLTRVAHYLGITRGDDLRAKDEYLDFLKKSLVDLARSEKREGGAEFLDALEEEIEKEDLATFDVAKKLNLFNFEEEPDDPLRILAGLPIPIYLTTSYHDFMEAALAAAGKKPRSEICYWREDLRSALPPLEEEEPDYSPSEEEPLVYHLLGREVVPSSMVLTEDDYFDFLVQVSREPEELLHPKVNQALADSLLVLLGFRLKGWDFRVLLRGIIKPKPAGRRPRSISIQLLKTVAGNEERLENLRSYLQEYFKENKFDVYWGDVAGFARELRDHWS